MKRATRQADWKGSIGEGVADNTNTMRQDLRSRKRAGCVKRAVPSHKIVDLCSKTDSLFQSIVAIGSVPCQNRLPNLVIIIRRP